MKPQWNEEQDKKLSPEEKQQAILDMQYKQERMVSVGKAIVIFIAAANVAMSIFALIAGTTGFISLVIQIVFSVALVSGANWARILFLIGLGIGIVVGLYGFLNYDGTSPLVSILFFTLTAYSIAAFALLLANKSVSEYMYSAKNG